MLIGLHAHIEIRYMVDYYKAEIISDNEMTLASAKGTTIEEALGNLDFSYEEWRSKSGGNKHDLLNPLHNP